MAMKKNISKALAMAVMMSVLSGANMFGCSVASAYDIYGAGNGNITNDKTKSVHSNNDFTVNENAENVYGGIGPFLFGIAKGDSLNNKVTISEGVTVSTYAYGGFADEGNANGNTVVSNATIVDTVVGGYSTKHPEASGKYTANENTVEIKGEAVSVFGGINNYGAADKNDVTINGTAKKIVVGGKGETSANGNKVTITSTGEVTGYSYSDPDDGVYGGWSNQTAKDNEVNVSGTVKIKVYGGYSETGNVDNNTVTASGDAEITGNVFAGYTKAGDAGCDQGNKLTIKGGKLYQAFAGYSEEGNVKNNIAVIEGGEAYALYGGGSIGTAGEAKMVSDNSVTVKGGTTFYAIGGDSWSYNVTKNTATIKGGSTECLYGGSSYNGTVGSEGAANQVFVEGGEVTNLAAGGYSEKGAANNNKATISDGKVKVLAGGYSEKGAADNNEVTVYGGEVTEAVYGGYSETGTADTNTINLGTQDGGVAKIGGNAVISYANGNNEPSQAGKDVLNVYGSGHTIGGNLYATKANLNFYIKAEDLHTGGKTMVDVTGTANITDSTINAGVMNVGQVDVGDKITLLSAGTLDADATLKTGKLSDGLIDVDLQIAQEGNSITATAGKAYVPEEPPKEEPPKENNESANPNAKSPVETMAAAISLLNAGSDMLATSSIMNAEQAVQMEKESAEAEGGMTVFTTVSGSNKRINSGSHVDMKAWNANLGLAKEIANKSGKFLFAPVVEYGRGSYDSYLDNGVHGEGDSHFVGGGLLAKQTFNSNWYVDGSVRAGRMSADYKTADIGTGVSYDNSATYYAAHLGAGKVVKMSEKSSMDYYGKLFYTHQNSSTANLSTGHTYEFDAVDSFRTLLGLRYSQKASKTASFYTGLAWQHEFDSECNATVRSGAWSAEAPAPSVKGDTGILEVGYKFTPGNCGNFDVDFGAAGYVGKQRGGSLKLNMQWKF